MAKIKDQTFSHDWLSGPKFKMWLPQVPVDNKLARCKHCRSHLTYLIQGVRL